MSDYPHHDKRPEPAPEALSPIPMCRFCGMRHDAPTPFCAKEPSNHD